MLPEIPLECFGMINFAANISFPERNGLAQRVPAAELNQYMNVIRHDGGRKNLAVPSSMPALQCIHHY